MPLLAPKKVGQPGVAQTLLVPGKHEKCPAWLRSLPYAWRTVPPQRPSLWSHSLQTTEEKQWLRGAHRVDVAPKSTTSPHFGLDDATPERLAPMHVIA